MNLMRASQTQKTHSSRIVLVLASSFIARFSRLSVLFASIACVLLASCAKHKPSKAPAISPPARIGEKERGEASWYGEPYHGRRSASGEIYDMEQFVAAHRTLPFQTWLEVTNLNNGKKVEVRVIDRGPFVDGRIVDLSRAAAREIDLLRPGIAKVELRVIEPPKNPPSPPSSFSGGGFTVQAGAFRDRDRADALLASLLKVDETRLSPTAANPPLWRVWVGKNLTPEEAEKLASKVKAVSGQALVVHEEE